MSVATKRPIEEEAHIALLRVEYADTNEHESRSELNLKCDRVGEVFYERMRRLGRLA